MRAKCAARSGFSALPLGELAFAKQMTERAARLQFARVRLIRRHMISLRRNVRWNNDY